VAHGEGTSEFLGAARVAHGATIEKLAGRIRAMTAVVGQYLKGPPAAEVLAGEASTEQVQHTSLGVLHVPREVLKESRAGSKACVLPPQKRRGWRAAAAKVIVENLKAYLADMRRTKIASTLELFASGGELTSLVCGALDVKTKYLFGAKVTAPAALKNVNLITVAKLKVAPEWSFYAKGKRVHAEAVYAQGFFEKCGDAGAGLHTL
jgi:hypothetical protein